MAFATSNRFLPRWVTDCYVKHIMNIPMKLGGGSAVMYQDFAKLKEECTQYESSQVVVWYQSNLEEFKRSSQTKIRSRGRVFLSALTKPLSRYDRFTILDIGGGWGNDYSLVKDFIGLDCIEEYIICENKLVVENFKKEEKINAKLHFIKDLNELQGDKRVEFIYLSGTLQYIDNPPALLERALQLKPHYFFVNRTPLWQKPTRLTKQLKPRSENERQRLSYACWIFNEEELLDFFKKRGFEAIEFDYPYDGPYICGFGILKNKAYFFENRDVQ